MGDVGNIDIDEIRQVEYEIPGYSQEKRMRLKLIRNLAVVGVVLIFFSTIVAVAPITEAAIYNRYVPPYYGTTQANTWLNGYWSAVWKTREPSFNKNTGFGTLGFNDPNWVNVAIYIGPAPTPDQTGKFKCYFGMNVDFTPRVSKLCRVDFVWHAKFDMQGRIRGLDIEHDWLDMQVYATSRIWDNGPGWPGWITPETWTVVFDHRMSAPGPYDYNSGPQDITITTSVTATLSSIHTYRLVTTFGGYGEGYSRNFPASEELDMALDLFEGGNCAQLTSVTVTYL